METRSPIQMASKIIDAQNCDYKEAMDLLNEAMQIMIDAGMQNINFADKVEQFLIRSGQRTLTIKTLFGELNETNRT